MSLAAGLGELVHQLGRQGAADPDAGHHRSGAERDE
jgi:hypothetical protein